MPGQWPGMLPPPWASTSTRQASRNDKHDATTSAPDSKAPRKPAIQCTSVQDWEVAPFLALSTLLPAWIALAANNWTGRFKKAMPCPPTGAHTHTHTQEDCTGKVARQLKPSCEAADKPQVLQAKLDISSAPATWASSNLARDQCPISAHTVLRGGHLFSIPACLLFNVGSDSLHPRVGAERLSRIRLKALKRGHLCRLCLRALCLVVAIITVSAL